MFSCGKIVEDSCTFEALPRFCFETLARKLATSTHAFAFNVQMQVRILAVNPLHPNV